MRKSFGTTARRGMLAVLLIGGALVAGNASAPAQASSPQPASACTISGSGSGTSYQPTTVSFGGPLVCRDGRHGTFSLDLDLEYPQNNAASTWLDGIGASYKALTQHSSSTNYDDCGDYYEFELAFQVQSGVAKGAVVPWRVTVYYPMFNFPVPGCTSTQPTMSGVAVVATVGPVPGVPTTKRCQRVVGSQLCATVGGSGSPAVTDENLRAAGPTSLTGAWVGTVSYWDNGNVSGTYITGDLALSGVYDGRRIVGHFKCSANHNDFFGTTSFGCETSTDPAKIEVGPPPVFGEYATLDLGITDVLTVPLGDGSTMVCTGAGSPGAAVLAIAGQFQRAVPDSAPSAMECSAS
ncbi:MAG TPA: hypothetical protein VNB24_06605 [Acidimicrobiales bacterium]|nr:hypothetical protein [Acidimicrobiales bacterium]